LLNQLGNVELQAIAKTTMVGVLILTVAQTNVVMEIIVMKQHLLILVTPLYLIVQARLQQLLIHLIEV